MNINETDAEIKRSFKYHMMKNLFNLFMILFSCIAFSSSNSISFEVLYYIPLLIILTILQNIVELKQIKKNQRYKYSTFYKFHGYYLLFTSTSFSISIALFYGLFQPLFGLDFKVIENCQVIGVMPMNQVSYEKYTILYVDYQYENQQFLGYGCMSNNWNQSSPNQIIYEGDQIPCDYIGASFQPSENLNQKSRLLQSSSKIKQQRLLRQRGKCYISGKISYSQYNFSKVKMSSWMCLPDDTQYENLIKQQRCYVHFFKHREKSYLNSKHRVPLKDTYNFALTVFQVPFYYTKSIVTCLIILGFIPFLVNCYPFSMIISFYLIKTYSKKDKHFFNMQ